MKNIFNLIMLSGLIFLIINSKLIAQQPFPISLDANGGEVFIESMDIGPDEDIYITGSIKNYVNIQFGPNCGDDVTQSESTGGDRIFIARLHADPADFTLDNVVWMVIGKSNIGNTGGIFSGKDIEVSSDGSVFLTGTLVGDVEFKRVIGGAPSPINSCFSTSDFRHFAGRIASDGEPIWVSDTDGLPSYGEGITLDEANNRLFTGGYIGNTTVAPMSFTDGSPSCTGACSFTVDPIVGSPYVGFVSQYSLDGINQQAFQIGEKVMALDMDDLSPGHIWVTGSAFDTDSDVLLAWIPVNIVTPLCANYPPLLISIPGVGGAIGLDIAFTSDNNVAITGAFETNCFFSGAGLITTPPAMSDLFVAVYDPNAFSFSAAKSTTDLSPFSATNQSYLQRNSCIAADSYSTSHIAIAYDKDMMLSTFSDIGYIITKELTTSLLPPGVGYTSVAEVQIAPCACPPTPVNRAARAMEIEYGNFGSFGNSFLAGDYKAKLTIGACSLNGSGSWNDGFVGRITDDHSMFFRESLDEMANQKYLLYPNPSEGTFTINTLVEEGSESQVLHIFNINGQVVYHQNLNLQKGQNKIDLEVDLANGTYFVKITDNNSVGMIQKLVIFK